MLHDSQGPAERQLPAPKPARYIQAYPKEAAQATGETANRGQAPSLDA